MTIKKEEVYCYKPPLPNFWIRLQMYKNIYTYTKCKVESIEKKITAETIDKIPPSENLSHLIETLVSLGRNTCFITMKHYLYCVNVFSWLLSASSIIEVDSI